ncbi:hypothetical protein BPOR_1093g00010 [Botrytis porri]|uniref:Uncharacterized protein n=1 Tax=Botrytis porri TaxID=87229 RepID=A0A4Z1KJF2_9HELO|nr:hypothetical protein BPOR_1093g00010 [Botrytis porri]
MAPYMIEVTMLDYEKLPHYFIPVPPDIQTEPPSIGEFVQWIHQSKPTKWDMMEAEYFSRGPPFSWNSIIFSTSYRAISSKLVVWTLSDGNNSYRSQRILAYSTYHGYAWELGMMDGGGGFLLGGVEGPSEKSRSVDVRYEVALLTPAILLTIMSLENDGAIWRTTTLNAIYKLHVRS